MLQHSRYIPSVSQYSSTYWRGDGVGIKVTLIVFLGEGWATAIPFFLIIEMQVQPLGWFKTWSFQSWRAASILWGSHANHATMPLLATKTVSKEVELELMTVSMWQELQPILIHVEKTHPYPSARSWTALWKLWYESVAHLILSFSIVLMFMKDETSSSKE
jgi:hypothetical protein